LGCNDGTLDQNLSRLEAAIRGRYLQMCETEKLGTERIEMHSAYSAPKTDLHCDDLDDEMSPVGLPVECIYHRLPDRVAPDQTHRDAQLTF
jgi:hypothetical protein